MSVAKFRWNLGKYLSVGNQRGTLCISLRGLAEHQIRAKGSDVGLESSATQVAFHV